MTDVDICNLALSYLGDSAKVTSIDPPDGSTQAQYCARFYPIAVGMMLESHQWNFITKRVELALLQTPPLSGRWQFAYAYPADVADLISVLPTACYAGTAQSWLWNSWNGWDGAPLDFEEQYRKDFQVELLGTVEVILSNECDAIARYTSNQVMPGQFPVLFAEALAWLLASKVAGPLMKGDAGMKQALQCLQVSQRIAGQAMMKDSNQRHGNLEPRPTWMVNR